MLAGQLRQTHYIVLAIGVAAILLLVFGERVLPGKPVALAVVALSIIAASLACCLDVQSPDIFQQDCLLGRSGTALARCRGHRPSRGGVPAALLSKAFPPGGLSLQNMDTTLIRRRILRIGAANLGAALGHGYPVAGGLSQSAVNDKAGAQTPLALVFASMTLALCLLFLTGFLEISRRRSWLQWCSPRYPAF